MVAATASTRARTGKTPLEFNFVLRLAVLIIKFRQRLKNGLCNVYKWMWAHKDPQSTTSDAYVDASNDEEMQHATSVVQTIVCSILIVGAFNLKSEEETRTFDSFQWQVITLCAHQYNRRNEMHKQTEMRAAILTWRLINFNSLHFVSLLFHFLYLRHVDHCWALRRE